jgi:hypothetical protein
VCFVAQIAMFIFGIIALVKGTFSLSKTRAVRGAAARTIGAILMLPLPLALGIGFVIGMIMATQGKPVDLKSLGPLSAIDGVLTLVCFVIVVVIAFATARDKETELPPSTFQPPRPLDDTNPYKPRE